MAIERVSILLVLSVAVSGCGLVASGLKKNSTTVLPSSLSLSTLSGSPVAAFQTSFYSFARNNCVQCHGSSQVPLFANSNVNTAYSDAKPFADFNNPSNSLLAEYAGNNHCGVSNCSGQSAAATAALSVWAAVENNPSPGSTSTPGNQNGNTPTGTTSGNGGDTAPSAMISYYTAPVAVPTNIPGAGTSFAIMRWNLSNLTPSNSDVTGDIFEVQIQKLTSTTYRLTLPKLAATRNLLVSGIHVLIKAANSSGYGSEYSLGLAWNAIDVTIPSSTIPTPLPTTSLNAPQLSVDAVPLPVINGPGDLITIGFETLRASNGATTTTTSTPTTTPTATPTTQGCRNLSGTNGFVSNVKPQMQNICFNCHLAGGGGYGSFPMVNNDDATLCKNSLPFIDTANPSNSPLVLRPQGFGGHPNFTGTFNPQPFINWIQTE